MFLLLKKVMMLSVSLLLLGAQVQADYSAQIYEQGSNRQNKLYDLKVKSQNLPSGDEELLLTYLDPQGTVVHLEKFLLKNNQIVKAEIQQKQLDQSAEIEVQSDKVVFTKTVNKKTKKSDEKKQETFVMSGNFQKFIQQNWSQLSEGKTVDFRYGVWDRQETVGFSLFKTSDEVIQGDSVVVLKMKPSSFIIAALVKPLIFKYKKDGTQLLEMSGRVAPKRKDGDKFKDLDAEVVYAY